MIYPNCSVDSQGKPIDGKNRYVLAFTKGGQPPVAVFWNMAMYGADMLFVKNDFGRVSIRSTTDGLKPAAEAR